MAAAATVAEVDSVVEWVAFPLLIYKLLPGNLMLVLFGIPDEC